MEAMKEIFLILQQCEESNKPKTYTPDEVRNMLMEVKNGSDIEGVLEKVG